MIRNLQDFKEIAKNKEFNHIFFLSSPIVVFISKLIIEEFSIPEKNIFVVPFRNTNTDLISNNLINQESSLIDRVIKKYFLFSYQGIKLRKKVETFSNKFILYSDWDNRETLELLNSKNCFGNAYIEEGQLSFHKFYEYPFKRNRILQWMRLFRWNQNIKKMPREADVPVFNEIFNDKAFGLFTISKKAFPYINNEKKYIFKDFEAIKKSYRPRILGTKNIGIMCSPRRFKNEDWEITINNFIDLLPNKSAIKLHPAYFANDKYLDKFIKIFNKNNFKNLTICDNSIILEAEMLFEKKTLYGPMTSLNTYAPLLGSEFIDISIY